MDLSLNTIIAFTALGGFCYTIIKDLIKGKSDQVTHEDLIKLKNGMDEKIDLIKENYEDKIEEFKTILEGVSKRIDFVLERHYKP